MNEPSKSCGCLDLMLLLNRLSMGTMLVLAGVMKVRGGVREFVDVGFSPIKPGWLPDALGRPYAYAIPFLEIGLGAVLALGLFTRGVTAVVALMILSFTMALALANGVGLTPGQMAVFTNMVYITLLLLLMTTGGGRYSLDAALFKGCCRKSA